MRDSRDEGDARRLSRAQAVLGRALRMLGEIDLAERALRDAIDVADRVSDDELTADAHLALAGVLSLGGSTSEALEHLDAVERVGSVTLRNSARLQRAVLYLRSGRTAESLALFDRAIPGLRRDGATLDLARVLANRGMILLHRGDALAAIADFEEAESLFSGLGHRFAAVQVHQNVGCAYAGRGDVPHALRVFDETAAGFAELGHDDSVPLLSRAEALLAGGLSADAFEFAGDAARRLRAEGNHSAAAEALVALAEAARLEGDPAVALDAATHARRWFASAAVDGWQRAAELLIARIKRESGGLVPSEIAALEELAAGMGDAGDVRGEVEALSVAASACCDAGDLDGAVRSVDLAAKAARRSRLLQTRLAVAHAKAMVCLGSHDLAGAKRHLRRGLDLLTSADVSGIGVAGRGIGPHAADITELSYRVAASERVPMRALEWMERARAAVPVSRPALPPESDELAAAFATLRLVSGELRAAELAGQPTGELRHRQASIERSIRNRALTATSSDGGLRHDGRVVARLRDLRALLGDGVLVSIAAAGDELVAVVVDRRGSRLCRLGSLAVAAMHAHKARAAVNALAGADPATAVAASRRTSMCAAVSALDDEIVAPLGLASDDVVLVVPDVLHAIPWAALPSLSTRAFRLAPSVCWWIDAVSAAPAVAGTTLAVAGPGLVEARAEAADVARCHRDVIELQGGDATVAAVCDALRSVDTAHIVAHGRFRHDNPLWSTIELDDGVLTVYELERNGPVPSTIVLATCESGVGGTRGGAQLHGLAATLLSMGARTVVAAIGALPDTAGTRCTMVGLHRGLAHGVAPSRSLAVERRRDPDATNLTSAMLVTLGVG